MYTHPASHIWPHGVDDEDIDALTLCDLDDLAEYLQSGKFATYVKSMTSEFSEKFDANRDAKTVAAIYEKTTEERPARTIFVDRFVAFGSATETRSHGFNVSPGPILFPHYRDLLHGWDYRRSLRLVTQSALEEIICS